jgi:peptidoglycan/xylan/chitin deacetylase (PgdA/CDA1 family)
MQRYVLAYHSHRVLGRDYAHNDHVALAADLQLIHDAGCRIVSLAAIVDSLSGDGRTIRGGDDRPLVAITFDDGPIYDAADFTHPRFGEQMGFVNILRRFVRANGRDAQPGLHATSFVIASPAARRSMETTYDAAHSHVGPGAMTDDWWAPAIATGLLSIANHSWDHLHAGLPSVAHSAQARGDFTRVLSAADADAQIAAASAYIDGKTQGRSAPFFAYPFGQYNAYLTDTYLPARGPDIGLRAAFTTDARPIADDESAWRLPRYVCGHHWTSPGTLRSILRDAAT